MRFVALPVQIIISTRVGDVRLEDCLSVESFPEWLDQQEIEEVINE